MVLRRNSLLCKFLFAFPFGDERSIPKQSDVCSLFWRLVIRTAILPFFLVLLPAALVLFLTIEISGFLVGVRVLWHIFKGEDPRPRKQWPTILRYRILPIVFVAPVAYLYILREMFAQQDLSRPTIIANCVIDATSWFFAIMFLPMFIAILFGAYTPHRFRATSSHCPGNTGFMAIILAAFVDFKRRHCTIVHIE